MRLMKFNSATVLFFTVTISVMAGVCGSVLGQGISFSLEDATVQEINNAFDTGLLTSERLVQLYLNRIGAYDQQGPALNSMITINPDALATAAALDVERRTIGPRGPLHGVPVIIKDLSDVAGMPTTGGMLALANSIPPDDSFVAGRLRAAGAVILGKTNLDDIGEGVRGLSSVLGQTNNPYDPRVVAGGSSAGTAAGLAANFAVVGTGTDNWGSVRLPASLNALIGLRPTLGLVSRDGTIVQTLARDTVGPMGRTVKDVASMLDVIAGYDPADPATAASVGQVPPSYRDLLTSTDLQGVRIGVARRFLNSAPSEVQSIVLAALNDMQSAGAVIVDPFDFQPQANLSLSFYNGFEYHMNNYLESLGPNAPFASVQDLIASGEYLPHLSDPCCVFATLRGDIPPEQDPLYQSIISHRAVIEAGFLDALQAHQVDFVVHPTVSDTPPFSPTSPFWPNLTTWRAMNVGAFLGLPSVSVPAGFTANNLPVGIEILGRAFSEPELLRVAYAYEQLTLHRAAPTSTPALQGEFLTADFDANDVLDGADADALVAEIAAMTNTSLYDLTSDGLVDNTDLTRWLLVGGAVNLPSGNPYLRGDANLDGTVDGLDFIAWNTNKFSELAQWTGGDFNADGFVDGQDFIMWNANKFMSSDGASAVPEPGMGVLVIAAVFGLAIVRRR